MPTIPSYLHDVFRSINSAISKLLHLPWLLAGLSLYDADYFATSSKMIGMTGPPLLFPESGNGLWYDAPAQHGAWSREWLPIGNGYLGATMAGGTAVETTVINIESFWSGGPMSNSAYNGGNKAQEEKTAMAEEMERIRHSIFSSPSGTINNIESLTTIPSSFGSYSAAGNLVSTLNVTDETVTNYARWLDLDKALLRTSWTQDNVNFLRTSFCSHPSKSCTQHLTTVSNSAELTSMPTLTFSMSDALTAAGLPPPNVTCLSSDTMQVRGTAEAFESGMVYEILFKASAYSRSTNNSALPQCTPTSWQTAFLQVPAGADEAWINWVGGTNYEMEKGDEINGFSFEGVDPHAELVNALSQYLVKNKPSNLAEYDFLLGLHLNDVRTSLTENFSLSLGRVRPQDFAEPTSTVKANYRTDEGNAYLEWLLFNYGRYLFWSSARGTLPANLQGIWVDKVWNTWSADYHANINVQMNYWIAEMTGLGELSLPLFNYIEKTWVPRGRHTANVLYNTTKGWVTHNEIFGHTGMKGGPGMGNTASYANYPEANAWMMLHVWDRFDFGSDIKWFQRQGWPLLKSTAEFHLSKLVPDLYTKDGTLVTAPCNSPEQGYITFGCAHAQQVIWQLLNAVERGYEFSGDDDPTFLHEVKTKRTLMDKGIRIGDWGQLQEWKLDLDSPWDTHRHLSHLLGLYPGYAITSYDRFLQGSNDTNYTSDAVMRAARVSLDHRGVGTGPDGDAGWEKVWRAACWAQFGKEGIRDFYHILTYAVERDIGSNLFSLYDPQSPNALFQIEANFGYSAAVLNALVQTPNTSTGPLIITLLPALPPAWHTGHLKGVRARGGIRLDLEWADGKLSRALFEVREDEQWPKSQKGQESFDSDRSVPVKRWVKVMYNETVVAEFGQVAGAGLLVQL